MRRNTKLQKLLVLLLAVSMVFSMNTIVFAENDASGDVQTEAVNVQNESGSEEQQKGNGSETAPVNSNTDETEKTGETGDGKTETEVTEGEGSSEDTTKDPATTNPTTTDPTTEAGPTEEGPETEETTENTPVAGAPEEEITTNTNPADVPQKTSLKKAAPKDKSPVEEACTKDGNCTAQIHEEGCPKAEMQIMTLDLGDGEEEPVWKIGENGYANLGDAVAAAPTDGTETIITLQKDASGGGVKVQSGQNIIFDFGGYTYTVGSPTVGSTGTETNGFQLLKGATVTMKNGTVKASNYQNLKIMIQNYCDLTLKDVTLDARESTYCQYVSSNNHGKVLITGATNIYAAQGQRAFDVYYWPQNGYDDGVSVTVDTTGTIQGTIEYGSDKTEAGKSGIAENAALIIKQGSIEGTISTDGLNTDNKTGITISGGTFSGDVSDYVADGNKLVKVDGKYTVATDENTAIAEVSGKGYMTIQEAINAAKAGDTVKLLQDKTESITIPEGADIILDLNGKKLTNETGKDTISNRGTLTIQGEGTVDNVTHTYGALVNYPTGKATLKGGTFTRSMEGQGSNSWYTVKNLGTMVIEEGTTVTTGANSVGASSLIANGWYNSSNPGSGDRNTAHEGNQTANLTILGGTFSGGMNTIKNDDYGVLEIQSGSFTNTTGPAILNWNEATISGGTFTVNNTASCVIANGYFAGSADKGQLTISGGTFTASNNGTGLLFGYGGESEKGGTFAIKGGSFLGSLAINDRYPYVPVISGGSFTEEVPTEYCADNFHPNKNADGTYSVHTHSKAAAVKENEKAATCTTSGSYDSVVYCSVCGEKMSRETVTVPAGHSYGTEWKTDGTNHWHECTVCGDKADVSAHTYGDWKVTKEATTEETGLREKTCKVCGHKVTEEIEKLKSSSSKKHHSSSSDSEQTVNTVVNVQASAVNSAKTGDNAPIMLLCVLCVVALAGIGAVVFYRRKKN